MVQVDIFWAYGLGATIAAVSGRQLVKEASPFINKYFVWGLLFLALIWNNTGVLLLLKHPSWESMQVFKDLYDIPPPVYLMFGITNITQGILGFWVSYKLIQNDRHYLANLNWLLGYFGMFFILIYGWDGMGLDRFFYDRDMFGGAPWTPGAGFAEGAGLNFALSSVAMTLYFDGLFLLPPLGYMIGKWTDETTRAEPTLSNALLPKHPIVTATWHLFIVFGVGFTSAALASLTVWLLNPLVGHVMSYIVGLPLFAVLAYFLLYRPSMPAHWVFQQVIPEERAKYSKVGVISDESEKTAKAAH
ncbi:hypothetical protein [Pelagibaculum spongiae]|uniref:Uncharacterized protein n=1 Tax=Pelagibaculum spongiae TaxID=2080658 RepID=A0A2V1GXF2_9GAMM|nr:hypothetical protein [Pelagibaculum spongiae]PVZ66385.1 hypothetical protein DC094_16965 [Pelagibaculum spongiae]